MCIIMIKKNVLKFCFLSVALTLSICLNSDNLEISDSISINVSAFTNIPKIIITSNEDFQSYNFSGVGSYDNPYIIDGYEILDSGIGIVISNTTENFVISNCKIESVSSGFGIFIFDVSSNFSIEGCLISTHYECIKVYNVTAANVKINANTVGNNGPSVTSGIHVKNSSLITISGNYCERNADGIRVEMSHNTVIENNRCLDSTIRVFSSNLTTIVDNWCFELSIAYCHFSSINNNLCDGKEKISNIVNIEHSSNLNITENTIINSWQLGFMGFHLENSLIISNVFQDNRQYGLALFYGSAYEDIGHNIIYMNSFYHNSYEDEVYDSNSQALDHGNNTWYNEETSEGNYWSDKDIREIYSIDGYSNAYDLYPLDKPSKPKYSGSFQLMVFTIIGLLSIVLYRKKKKEQKKKKYSY
ncbi:hypothetical protein ES705_07917 [subsurface metagenome]